MLSKKTFCLSLALLFAAVPLLAAPTKTARKKTSVPVLPGLKQPAPTAPMPVSPRAAVAPGAALYNGQAPDQAGVTLAGWGGGAAQDSGDIGFAGSHSVKITTYNLYEGAKISFNTPFDLGDLTAPNRYLEITLRFARLENADTARGFSRKGGRAAALCGVPPLRLAQARPPGFPMPGGIPGGGGMGLPGGGRTGIPSGGGQGQTPSSVETIHPPALETMRVALTLANGAQADILRPIPEPSPGSDSSEEWITLGIPVTALKFAGAASSPLKSITLGGNRYAVLYIGQIKTATDTTPITCYAGDSQDVARGDEVTLRGSATAGATALKYSWDFDTSDGVTEQADGQTVTTRYWQGGKDYKVTLTVSDIDGIKKSATAITTIHVEE